MAAEVRLPDDQLEELAELIAARLTGGHHPDRLVDANELAQLLGVARSTVYERSAELGAKRLTPRGRLRFDVAIAREAFAGDQHAGHAKPKPRRRRRKPQVGSVLKVRA